MVETTTAVLTSVRVIVLALGLLITYYSFEAYRRTGTHYLRNASIGFGIITMDVLIEGVLFQLGGLHLTAVHIMESIAIGLGFFFLLISLRR